MPKRYSIDLRTWIYRFLLERDGPFCRICGKPVKNPISLEIDHIDNDKTNDDPENLQLAHPKCNKLKEVEAKKTRTKVLNVSVEGSPATRMVKETVDYTTGSPEMKANSHFEVKYRQWIIRKIVHEGSVVKKEAINAGAEHVGCSPMTVNRYTDKLISELGPLAEIKDFANNNLLVFKEDIQKVLSSLAKTKTKRKYTKTKKTKKTKGATNHENTTT